MRENPGLRNYDLMILLVNLVELSPAVVGQFKLTRYLARLSLAPVWSSVLC
ncbi:MAG: hypothetical protein ACYDDS_11425 [Candidatus Sulfotelmatobacter sp.]|jgi:hypothetical protein